MKAEIHRDSRAAKYLAERGMDLKFALMDGEVFWTFNRIAIDQRLGRPEPLNGDTHRERDDFFFGVIGEWDRDLGMSHKKYEADKRR